MPEKLGGLNRGVCYIYTEGAIPWKRFEQIGRGRNVIQKSFICWILFFGAFAFEVGLNNKVFHIHL